MGAAEWWWNMALVEVYIEHGLRVTRRYEAGNGELFEGVSASSMGGFGREGGWGDGADKRKQGGEL